MDERPVITTSMSILLKWQELHNFSYSGRRLGKQAGLFCFVQEWKGMGRDGRDAGKGNGWIGYWKNKSLSLSLSLVPTASNCSFCEAEYRFDTRTEKNRTWRGKGKPST
jgi:hypothetical protein